MRCEHILRYLNSFRRSSQRSSARCLKQLGVPIRDDWNYDTFELRETP